MSVAGLNARHAAHILDRPSRDGPPRAAGVSKAGEGAAVASRTWSRRAWDVGVLVLLAFAVVVQLVVLYSPDGAGVAPFPQADKVVHALVFLLPVAVAVVARLRRRVVVAVFAAQAVLSEVVQALFLPHRSGDVLDAGADLAGIALGVLLGAAVLRSLASRARTRSGG